MINKLWWFHSKNFTKYLFKVIHIWYTLKMLSFSILLCLYSSSCCKNEDFTTFSRFLISPLNLFFIPEGCFLNIIIIYLEWKIWLYQEDYLNKKIIILVHILLFKYTLQTTFQIKIPILANVLTLLLIEILKIMI